MINTINNIQCTSPSFEGYKTARAYAFLTRFENKHIRKELCYCNLKWLNGIQKGLKSFEGLSMKQIAFVLTDLHAINFIRGCVNHCLHCYANAQPFIKRFPFENFKQIMDDIATLKQRLGFNPVSARGQKYIICGYDVDGIDTYLYDKDGKKHDAIEIGKIIHESTDIQMILDTNGWDRNNSEKQQIAEDYVKQLLDDENSKHIYKINVSLNPFNPKYVKAIRDGFDPKTYSPLTRKDSGTQRAKKNTKLQEAENSYNEYIANEVNTLFTLTPLLLQGKLNTLIRGLDKTVTNMDGCYLEDYAITLGNILGHLKYVYQMDLKTKQQVIKSEEMLQKAIDGYLKLFNKNSFRIFSSGRMEKLYKTRHNGSLDGIEIIDEGRLRSENNYNALTSQKKTSATDLTYLKIISPDGRIWLYDNYAMIPTDIKLNTGIEDVENPFSIKPKDFVVTTDMIDRI